MLSGNSMENLSWMLIERHETHTKNKQVYGRSKQVYGNSKQVYVDSKQVYGTSKPSTNDLQKLLIRVCAVWFNLLASINPSTF